MLNYKKAGVDRDLGDRCSEIAYKEAKKTFFGRHGMIGAPLLLEGGFTGALDMGDYLLVQNEDGVGTKIEVAERTGEFGTLGQDLVAMVADDAICVGAEVISISNTIDTSALSEKIVRALMKGMGEACRSQRIVIPGGEIAELKGHVNGYTWNATAVGVVKKERFIDGSKIRTGDAIIGIASPNFRSNGFTLLRAILKKAYGNDWHTKRFRGKTWGDWALEPCVIYHAGMLKLVGRFGEKPRVNMKGIAHITGGGLPGNAPRMFGKQKLGLILNHLLPVPETMKELQRLGNVSDREAYETWNMGTGMVCVAEDTKRALTLLRAEGFSAEVVGEVTKKPGVMIHTENKKTLRFE